MPERVKSKNLFNFVLNGDMDEDVRVQEAMSKATENEAGKRMLELSRHDDEDSVMEWLVILRKMLTQVFNGFQKGNGFYDEAVEDTEVTVLQVPTSHDGEFDVQVFVYTPKEVERHTKNAAYIYAHGGGAVGSSATKFNIGFLNQIAVDCRLVVFNVDYRKAPETKCPNNVKDFYEAIKFVATNADALGVDASKICIAGDSGGGYICLGACVLLAQHNETDLVKLAIPGIPMIGDYVFTADPLSMTIEERENCQMMRMFWKLISTDLEKQGSDPLLFPGKASDEILAKFPPIIIRENEFDNHVTEATRLANRLRRAGRLLEFIVIPGATHMATFMPGFKCVKVLNDAIKLVFQEYLFK